MSSTLGIALIVGASIAIFFLKEAVEKKQAPWSDAGILPSEKPDEIETHGLSISLEHLHVAPARIGGKRTYFTGYAVQLPPSMSGLGLIDTDARERWFGTEQYERIPTSGSPETPDGIFNGTFEFTEEHADASPLKSADIRDILMEVSETCRGVWLRHGKLCILDDGPFSKDQADVVGEYLRGISERLDLAAASEDERK